MNELDNLRLEVRGRGPCKVCGATGYGLSYGGTDICPACDCGVNPDVTRLKRELAEARAELLRLAGVEAELAALKTRIAEAPACNVFTDAKVYCCVPRDWIGKRVRLVVEK